MSEKTRTVLVVAVVIIMVMGAMHFGSAKVVDFIVRMHGG